MGKKKWIPILLALLPLAAGALSGLAVQNGQRYMQLQKPPLSPPGIVFPIVWSILYVLMGVGFYLANRGSEQKGISQSKILVPYLVQLFLNACWSFLFFGLGLYWLGAFWVLALIASIVWMMKAFYKSSPAAAYLQIPYLAWCCFAAYLSFGVAVLNG